MRKIDLPLMSGIVIVCFALFGFSTTSYAKSSNVDNVVCQDVELDDNAYVAKKSCFYPNSDLLTTYKNFRISNQDNEDGMYLKDKIKLGTDFEEEFESAYLLVIYRWADTKNLNVTLEFAGGMTELKFKQEDDGTDVNIIYSPD